jgi:hypothetical protein
VGGGGGGEVLIQGGISPSDYDNVDWWGGWI